MLLRLLQVPAWVFSLKGRFCLPVRACSIYLKWTAKLIVLSDFRFRPGVTTVCGLCTPGRRCNSNFCNFFIFSNFSSFSNFCESCRGSKRLQ